MIGPAAFVQTTLHHVINTLYTHTTPTHNTRRPFTRYSKGSGDSFEQYSDVPVPLSLADETEDDDNDDAASADKGKDDKGKDDKGDTTGSALSPPTAPRSPLWLAQKAQKARDKAVAKHNGCVILHGGKVDTTPHASGATFTAGAIAVCGRGHGVWTYVNDKKVVCGGGGSPAVVVAWVTGKEMDESKMLHCEEVLSAGWECNAPGDADCSCSDKSKRGCHKEGGLMTSRTRCVY